MKNDDQHVPKWKREKRERKSKYSKLHRLQHKVGEPYREVGWQVIDEEIERLRRLEETRHTTKSRTTRHAVDCPALHSEQCTCGDV
jgi:hypothetical protein